MKKILCLDFDGVICDSIEETLFVSYNAYLRIKNTKSRLILESSKIPQDIRDRYYKYRYLVGPAREYYALMKAVIDISDKDVPRVFVDICQSEDQNLESFSRHFFAVRGELKDYHRENWLDLHSVFAEFYDAWESVKMNFEVYIVTTKDHDSVVDLLQHYNIDIPEINIFAKNKFTVKKEAILEIIRVNHHNKQHVIFVDDNENHLINVSDSGVNCLLASWGYNSPGPSRFRVITNLLF